MPLLCLENSFRMATDLDWQSWIIQRQKMMEFVIRNREDMIKRAAEANNRGKNNVWWKNVKNDLFYAHCIHNKRLFPVLIILTNLPSNHSQLPNASAKRSLFRSTNANSLSEKCSRPKRGIINVHSSGKLFIHAILNNGKYPILGLSYFGVLGLVWSHVVCAGIYKRSTIQRNKAAAKLKPV